MRSALLLADSVRVALYAAIFCPSILLAASAGLDARQSFALTSGGPAVHAAIGGVAREPRSRNTGFSAGHSVGSTPRIISVTYFSPGGPALTRQGGSSLGVKMLGAVGTPGVGGVTAAPPRRPVANGATVTLWDEIAPPLPLPIPPVAAHGV